MGRRRKESRDVSVYFNPRSHEGSDTDRRNVDRVVSECVRKVIYEDKERITDRIVSQASSHLKNVALKKMMEKMTED